MEPSSEVGSYKNTKKDWSERVEISSNLEDKGALRGELQEDDEARRDET